MRVGPPGVGSVPSQEGQGELAPVSPSREGSRERPPHAPAMLALWSWASGLHHREKCMSVV